jgi:hypothetical protein
MIGMIILGIMIAAIVIVASFIMLRPNKPNARNIISTRHMYTTFKYTTAKLARNDFTGMQQYLSDNLLQALKRKMRTFHETQSVICHEILELPSATRVTFFVRLMQYAGVGKTCWTFDIVTKKVIDIDDITSSTASKTGEK